MIAASLNDLIARLPVQERTGPADVTVAGVTNDSRRVADGFLYAALPGEHVDGHSFISAAIASGARAILCERMPDSPPDDVAFVCVASARSALSAVSARFYRDPSREIPVVGVTGTDGKTTTTYVIDQLLGATGFESGFVSTALLKTDIQPAKNPWRQSTPEAPDVHAFLREMVDNGKQIAVVEATSHGLSERTARLKDVQFHVAVFTNLTHEHLEFHGTFEQYRSDKANLFRALDRAARHPADGDLPIFGVVNGDDPNAYYFRSATRQRVITYGLNDADADLRATNLAPDTLGTTCRVHWHRESREMRVPLPGPFNVENVLAAMVVVAHLHDRNPLDLVDEVRNLRPMKGRMQVIRRDLPFAPIVDYAHTPGAFEKVLPLIRGYTRGRLVVVFGSAGERDVAKRPMQGRLAARHADVVILTDEDPRGEDRDAIIADIAAGCAVERPSIEEEGALLRIADRRAAIRAAIAQAAEGDTLLFLGKGHEGSIIYADGPIDWDDPAVVAEELSATFGSERDA